jgi:TolA-binding protein
MKEPEPAPLPDDLLDYVAAAREPEPASAETKERLWARLGPLIPPAGGGSPTGDGGVGPTTGGAESVATTAVTGASGVLQGKVVVAAISAILGATGGAAMHATFAPPQTVVVNVPVAVTVAPSAELPLATSAEAPAEAASASATVALQPSASSEAPRKSTMRAERILLEAANAALMRGDRAAAVAALQQHKQTYPRGELAQERDILMAQANKLKPSDKGAAPR